MTQEQLKQAAQCDIRYFQIAYQTCPTCGRRFDEMHPMENLIPHWNGTCSALLRQREITDDND
jgi:hypothetical protein